MKKKLMWILQCKQMKHFVQEQTVISPIGRIEHGEKVTEYCNGKVGEITHELYHSLLDIQLLRSDDKHNWIHTVRM